MNVNLGIWDKLTRLMALLLLLAALLGIGLWYLPLIQRNERMRKEILSLDTENKKEEERQKQDELFSLLVDDQVIKGSLADSCLWYGRYLQSKFHHHWCFLAPALVGLEDNSKKPASGDLATVYSFVIEVAKLLKTRRNLALVDIVDELDNWNMLKPQMDEERAILNQVVFATLGWLSMY